MYFSILSFLADAAPAPGGGPGGILSSPIVPFAAVAIIMYVLMIRPQQKKQKELAALIASVKTGDKVVTTGGIHGIVSNVKDGATLSLKVADNVKIEVDKSAIASVDRSSSNAVVAA
jgi:preprotein translocase subunit YajC